MLRLIAISLAAGIVLGGCSGGGSPNRAPVVAPVMDVTISANETSAAIPITVTDDEATGALSVTASSSDQNVIADQGLVIMGTGGNLSLTVTPNPAVLGAATIQIRAADAEGGTGITSFTVNVVSQEVSFDAFFRSVFLDPENAEPRDVNSRTFIQDAEAGFADLL